MYSTTLFKFIEPKKVRINKQESGNQLKTRRKEIVKNSK